nr:hypothetical protein [Tanacetum cinerariifolium]
MRLEGEGLKGSWLWRVEGLQGSSYGHGGKHGIGPVELHNEAPKHSSVQKTIGEPAKNGFDVGLYKIPPKKAPMSEAAINRLIAQRVADALAEYETNQNSNPKNVNGDGSHDSRIGSGRPVRTARECTYKEFLNCQPLNFKGTEGVVGLTRCALTWWKSHVKTVGHDVKGTDVVSYTQRFQELALMCGRMLPEESDQVEKYVGGLPENIQGNVMSVRLKMMQEAIELANDLMDQKRQNVAIDYTVGPGEKKVYAKILPLCNKCNYHHNGPCTTKCVNCKCVGHLTRDCKSPAAANNQRTFTCFGCGNQGHYKSDCPKLKNQNRGNQAGSSEARGRVYALGGGEIDQDPNNIEDEIEASRCIFF